MMLQEFCGCLVHKVCHVLQKEEAELEKLREKERIRSGKELLEAKRKEDDLKLKRNLEARRIEKEEEQRARDKIRVKLGQCCALQACVYASAPQSCICCLAHLRPWIPTARNDLLARQAEGIILDVIHAGIQPV